MRPGVRPVGVALLLAGCTFPSAEYDGACDVPPACVREPQDCGDTARSDHISCKTAMGCGTPCKAACDTTFVEDIKECNHQCLICAKEQGCLNASASCSELVGQ